MIGSLAIGRRRLPAAMLGAPLPPSLAHRRALFGRQAFEIGPALLRRHVAEAAAERAAAPPALRALAAVGGGRLRSRPPRRWRRGRTGGRRRGGRRALR